MPRLVFFIFLLIPLFCTRETPKVAQQAAAKKTVQRQAVVGAVTIRIQPFEDMPAAYTQYVEAQLRKFYSKVQVMPPINFPPRAMNAAGTRYKADSLNRFLHNITPTGSLSMGLTLKDISTNKNGNPDWGVFGLGYCPGKACVASLYRLKGVNRLEKLFKVAIHELGHTQGLQHCPVPTCLMRDAAGKDRLNELTGFCAKCSAVLKKAGWVLK